MKHHILVVALLSLTSAAVDARLIRGGGRGSPVAPPIIGDSVYLLPLGSAPVLTPGDVANAAEYAFTGDAVPISVQHDYGKACAFPLPIPGGTVYADGSRDVYDCYFELGADEVLEWQANLIGLPDLLSGGDTPYLVTPPDFTYSWSLVGNGAELFSWNETSAEAPLGVRLPYAPAPDEFSGCYAKFRSYDIGDCQKILLDLNQAAVPLTGADLFALSGGEDLFLDISVEIQAPAGAEFVTIYDFDNPIDPQGAVVNRSPVVIGLAERLRIVLASEPSPVPVPAPAVLILAGLALLGLRRCR